MSASSRGCPVCDADRVETLLELPDLPAFCNVQHVDRTTALSQPSGTLTLALCAGCGHLFNRTFDPSTLEYDQDYENSLHFSAVFNRFARELAERLVERYDLHGKRVIDVGCGKGDFLALLCDLGQNDGFGFDRSFEEGRVATPERGSVRYFGEYFGPERAGLKPDLVSCRHVLEHIPRPVPFLAGLAGAARESADCRFYLEVPNALFTVRDLGIWDLIYEHAHYFSAPSLDRACRRAGIATTALEETFGGQYLSLEGRLGDGDDDPERVAAVVETAREFPARFREKVARWRDEMSGRSGRTVVWGGGSKGVTFLNLVRPGEAVAAVVDVNPHKQGRFVAGTGHEIVGPDALASLRPELVLVMNPLYRDEIARTLDERGVTARLRVVD